MAQVGRPRIKKTINFLGRSLSVKNPQDLAKQAGITTEQANTVINQPNIIKYIYNKRTNVLLKVDVHNTSFNQLRNINLRKKYDKKLFSANGTKLNRDVVIYDNIPDDIYISIKSAVVSFSFDASDKRFNRIKQFQFPDNVNVSAISLNDYVIEEVDKYMDEIGEVASNTVINRVEATTYYTESKLLLEDVKLRRCQLKIYNQVVNAEENDTDDNCVRSYLVEKLHKKGKGISINRINKIGNEDGVSVNEIAEFANEYKIHFRAYNINGVCIKNNIDIKPSKSYPALNFIAYNNHLYPINGKEPTLTEIDFYKCDKIIKEDNRDTAIEDISELIKNNNTPAKIRINDKLQIVSYVSDKKLHIYNSSYNKCLDILKTYGLEHKIYPNINVSRLFPIIEDRYIKTNINSFFPLASKIKLTPLTYSNPKQTNTETTTIDKNLCYTSLLHNLPYLIHFDFRRCIITKSPKTITDHFLYIASPRTPHFILMPNRNIYDGAYIKYCMSKNIDIELEYEITAEKSENYYTSMIDDLLKNHGKDITKQILNINIGRFQMQNTDKTTVYKVDNIYNNEEAKMDMYDSPQKLEGEDYTTQFFKRINEDYVLKYTMDKQAPNIIHNRLPIASQIFNMNRLAIYEKLIEIQEENKTIINVLQIKTDSITIEGKFNVKNINTDIDGWKYEQYNPTRFEPPYDGCEENLFDNILPMKIESQRTIYNCYAGAGKTYYIKNTIIPTVEDDYIVMTPTHASLQDFKKNDLNCCIIDRYLIGGLAGKLPKENNIIIDEHSMISKEAHNFLYKCVLAGKNIHSFGDYNQFPPVEPTNNTPYKIYNNPYYIKMMFNNTVVLDTNWRNDFTTSYYDSLINSYDNKFLTEEVKKYSTDTYKTADVIIAYTNATVDKYNKLKMKDLKLEDDTPSLKIICTTNDLHSKGLYNNYETHIIRSDSEHIYIDGDLLGSPEIQIKREDYVKFFKPAYAKTLYKSQGQSIKRIFYAPEDYKYIDNTSAYVFISRLQTKYN
jgi:hypothetical protein